ncbi:MAG: nucleoside deaminase [Bacteriovoracaceae bacterium]|nr:nucleoside deaminase [Bacteriovoracaceae bacterium]
MKHDFEYMGLALQEALCAFDEHEVPVGAMIVSSGGRILARAHNIKEKTADPTAHAELIAIREACQEIRNWRLVGCVMYVTMEPCVMCLSAIQQARINRLVFGAYDSKGGAISLGHNIHCDRRLNHKFDVVGGIGQYESSQLLRNFFRARRRK